jgi:hypothetical protein
MQRHRHSWQPQTCLHATCIRRTLLQQGTYRKFNVSDAFQRQELAQLLQLHCWYVCEVVAHAQKRDTSQELVEMLQMCDITIHCCTRMQPYIISQTWARKRNFEGLLTPPPPRK